MGSGKVHVDPELLRQAATKTQGVSDRISNALTTLKSSTDGLGTPWGDDEYGKQFADGKANNGYLAALSTLHNIVSGLVDHSGSHAEGQHSSADYHADTDERTAERYQ